MQLANIAIFITCARNQVVIFIIANYLERKKKSGTNIPLKDFWTEFKAKTVLIKILLITKALHRRWSYGGYLLRQIMT